MSLRPHYDFSGDDTHGTRRPEIHHPTPTRAPGLQRRVTIATETNEQPSTWPHYVPATATLNSEKVEQSAEGRPGTTLANVQRSPSAPPAVNHPPAPPPATIHPVLTVRPALRGSSHPRVHLTWDVRFSPDAPPPPPPALGRRDSTVSSSTTPRQYSTRPRSNTQPASLGLNTDLALASDMHARLNLNRNTHPGPSEGAAGQTFASHPVALEPATSPPRARMLIVCRDLLPWLIPVYARDSEVGCTVLDVVRGIYGALQTKVEVAGHMRSASDGTRTERERRRVDWLRDKTVFVCLGRDEALVRRRLPGRDNLWEETFVLTLARRSV